MAEVITITQRVEASRLASMHSRLLTSIERLQINVKKHGKPTSEALAEADNLIEEGFKDCRALEAGYLALTGKRLERDKPKEIVINAER